MCRFGGKSAATCVGPRGTHPSSRLPGGPLAGRAVISQPSLDIYLFLRVGEAFAPADHASLSVLVPSPPPQGYLKVTFLAAADAPPCLFLCQTRKGGRRALCGLRDAVRPDAGSLSGRLEVG